LANNFSKSTKVFGLNIGVIFMLNVLNDVMENFAELLETAAHEFEFFNK